MIWVTGANGVVGRAVCAKLRQCGISHLPIVRERRRQTPASARVLDLSIHKAAIELCKSPAPSAIIHLAAAVPHSPAYPDTEETASITRRIDRNIYDLQLRFKVPVVYASSCGLYDKSTKDVKQEDTSDILTQTPYFTAKLAGERLFADKNSATILRLGSVVGEGMRNHLVFSRFVAAACAGRPLQVWGRGTREQNFVDANDVAELLLRIIEKPKFGIFNVAASAPITMFQLAKLVVETVGSGTVEFISREDPCEAETARYSISKAQAIFGWQPTIDLEKSCRNLSRQYLEKDR